MDLATYMQFILVLILVLGMILAVVWVLRRLGAGALPLGSKRGRRRLGIVEVAAVDQKRRLVLIRRDDVEHLVLTGGGSDVVIESRIATSPDAPEEPPVSGPARQPFAAMLNRSDRSEPAAGPSGRIDPPVGTPGSKSETAAEPAAQPPAEDPRP